MRHLRLGCAVAALIAPMAVQAQETTSIIRGSVTADGVAVSNADIVVTNVPSGTVSRARTDSSGNYSVSGLRSGGPYTVNVTAPNGSAKVDGVFTVVGQPYDLPLEIGEQAIVVTASSIKRAGVTSDGPQTVLDATDIAKVASVNRDIRDIERRSPFATIDLTNSRAVSFAGVNPRFNRFTINGAQVGDTFGLNPDASPTRRGPVPFDAIAQVSVSIAPFDIRQSNFQGGVIDSTLLSGTNDFHVNAFYSQSTSGLQGKTIKDVTITVPKYKSETYGATVSGPIIRDKLFFMGAYERNTDPRPLSPGQASGVPGLTDALVTQVQTIAKNVYNYDTGGILPITNNLDEKFVVKLDANLTDRQKLSFSYINSYDATDSLVNSGITVGGVNTSAPTSTALGVSLASNDYKLTELLRTGIVQLNSDWTDRLSTEARFVYKFYTRGQDPEQGRGFAQFKVCTAPTLGGTGVNAVTATSCGAGNPVLYFGPDISRQTNSLSTETYDGSFLVRFSAGDHAFKGFVQYVENSTTNAFLQYSAGAYYFPSLADFQARNASQFDYQNALTLNPNDTQANFKYGVYTAALQDDWTINDSLKVTLGARYDLYQSNSAVLLNQNFVNRYGFRNSQNFNGLDAFQPRFSFDYKPTSRLNVRGGIGVFSGGTPDIYFSNSYSNTGVVQNRIQAVIRATANPDGSTATCTATSPYVGANAGVCTAALNGVTGTSIPGAVNTFLSTNTASLATAGTASVDPRFQIPSQTRFTISADYKLWGINFGADYVYSKTNKAVIFTDLRSARIGTLPDGRPRYNFVATPGVTTATDTNSDIQISNTSLGRSHVGVVRFDKEWKNGVSVSGSYTYQDVKDVSNATSSVATSLYNAQASADPNVAAYGTSSDQTKWQFKYAVGYDHAFFGDYRTIIQLFGETRAGRPFSYTAQDLQSGRSAVFGTLGNNNKYLLYVPTGPADPLVSYDTTTSQTALDTLINGSILSKYRGTIAPKNIARSRANTRIDLHLEQEIPTGLGHSRLSVFGDIENLPNLINKDWGGLYQFAGFPYTATAVQVQCLAAVTPTGTAGVVATNPTQACAQYRYSNVRSPTESVTSAQSLYLVRVGVRFKF